MNPAACAKQLRRDLLTGVATELRAVELHKPHHILGLGQGGIIALAMGRPLVETAMWARSVQHEESVRMAAAWKAVKGCVAVQPRPGKARFSPDALLGAVPEWKVFFHVKGIFSVAVSPFKSPTADAEHVLCAAVGVPVVRLGEVGSLGLLSSQDRESWEHAGKCACGKKVFLGPECLRCSLRDVQGSGPVEASELEQEPGEMIGTVGRQSAAPAVLLSGE